MRTIFKTIIVASAIVTGGSAFANDSGESNNSQAITSSELAYSARSNMRQAPYYPAPYYDEVVPTAPMNYRARAAIVQGQAPVDTSTLSNGSNN